MLARWTDQGAKSDVLAKEPKPMKQFFFSLSVLMIALLTASTILMGQSTMNVTFMNSPSSTMHIAPMDTVAFPAFANHFAAGGGVVQPASIVLSNESDRSIVGLVVVWTIVDKSGASHRLTGGTDSFWDSRYAKIIDPHARTLAFPGGFLSESLANAPHIGRPITSQRIQEFSNASQVKVEIDCVIDDTGAVLGPNSSRQDENITARISAAAEVVALVRNAENAGQDYSDVLRPFATAGFRVSAGDRISFWRTMFARRLLNSKNLDIDLARLQLPPLPKFNYVGNG